MVAKILEMDDKGLISTTVMISGRSYPLKISASDEPTIKKIVKEVNEKVNSFSTAYTKKDKQDCLAMVLLTYAVDLHKSKKEPATDTPQDSGISDSIHQLESLLDTLLQPSEA